MGRKTIDILSDPVRLDYPGAPRRKVRFCDAPFCQAEGLYKAPRGRDSLEEYYWFCLPHVQEYNRRWDFFAGYDQQDLEEFIRQSACWGRATRPMGGGFAHEARLRQKLWQEFADKIHADDSPDEDMPHGKIEISQRRAFAVLSLYPPVSFAQVKEKYRELVKKYHPDLHPDDDFYQEKLKKINLAYQILKDFYKK